MTVRSDADPDLLPDHLLLMQVQQGRDPLKVGIELRTLYDD